MHLAFGWSGLKVSEAAVVLARTLLQVRGLGAFTGESGEKKRGKFE
jgi:hypothetical protein